MRQVIPAVSLALNKSLLAALLVASPLVVSTVAKHFAPESALASVSAVQAQVTAKNKHANEQRKFPNLSEAFGKRIQEAANALQPPEESKAQPDPRKALQILGELSAKGNLNAYEQVLLNQYTGYAHLGAENYPKAIESFNKMLTLVPNMPVATEAQTYLTLGQLYSAQDNPRKALELLLKWTEYVDSLRPEQQYMFASLYYQLEDNRNSLLNINEAVKNQEATGKVPIESWYLLQRGLYFDKEDYKSGLVVLEKLIKHYPKAQYWRQASQVYRMMNREKDALAAMEACYLLNGLESEKDLLNLAYMFLEAEVPYKAAKVLNRGIYETKKVEPSAKNLKLLADSWRLAQNVRNSLTEYEKAAAKSTDGELIIGLAGAYLANDNYKDASKWGRDALRKGGIKRVDLANFTVAQAELEMKNYDEAIKFFKEAGKDARSSKVANQWATYAEKEKEKAELAKRGI
ncbi:tetratricopeptide repeat protein [Cellvibrio japonicus]|uniref:TPR domain protein n=1 Tax=Cellvibrio japonicus (strain Ueda107) TaxID=498211 RepID=B3PIW5_CELJU|nr:hypothetical protein [Cellvibrio japonicus]ACE84861.1 TPR domain protein [Cellvibrio japonicus Ueda107]QEI11174.1 hypothetical protein FY117_02295 [Cellvibrio japonicus]QEI14748.1 hypothetical protein FY116_02295 [Cellvibrio japonicus]QEI18328.1 hypothetical protein FY115_02295 [Cellvibrio japonicus]